MRIIKKSIIRKLFFHLFWFALLISALFFYFYYKEVGSVPYYWVIAALGAFLIFFLIVYWVDIVKPLRSIMIQIQSLLGGKPYKRIYTNRVDEIGIIAHFFNQVTKGLGKVSYDLKDRERMLDELTIASQLQRDILPLKSPSVPGLQIVAKNKPATEVGGDSFDMITINNKTYIYIGDVTGHGVAAGLIMTMVNSLVKVFADIYDNAYDIIVNVNKNIKKHVKKAMYMTMVMLCWDHENKKMTYVGAGHEYILIYRSFSGECEEVLSGGVALGMVPDNSKIIKEKNIELNNGDFVILYTDGITEAKNSEGEMYGLERLKQAIKEYVPQYSAEGVNYHVAKDVSAFMEGQPQEDDMTLIVAKRDDKIKKARDEAAQSTSWGD
ncbi:SpoIIE family protein phosphatase [Candidatus Peregrinibacteria bacterium]|nr:SpoIIE family protein phosphatase [Candidatus Peregrinibacteria bacterium]